jgi:hypothetical protein
MDLKAGQREQGETCPDIFLISGMFSVMNISYILQFSVETALAYIYSWERQ